MSEKGKISSYQMGVLMYPTILATAILIVPAITMKYANRDAWISPIWGSVIGFLLIYITIRLNRMYPNYSFIEASEFILGRILGKLFGFLFFFSYLMDTGFVMREYGEFVVGNFLPMTPDLVIMGIMLLVCAVTICKGIEVLARCAQIFVPLVLFFLFLIILLLVPDFHFNKIYPIAENGIKPSIRGAVTPAGWFGDFLFLSFLLPHISNRNQSVKWAVGSVIAIMMTMAITNFVIILLFGAVASKLTYPVMVAARYVSLADFLSHMEALVMAVWVLAIFIKICVYYYTLVLITTHWLKLPNFQIVVFPLGVLLVEYSEWVTPNIQYMSAFFDKSGIMFFMTIKVVLPVLLLAVALVREKALQHSHN